MKSRLAVQVPVSASTTTTRVSSSSSIQYQRRGVSLKITNNNNNNSKSISVIWFIRLIVFLILLLLSHSVWIIWKTVKFHYVIDKQQQKKGVQPNNNNNNDIIIIQRQVITKQETKQQQQTQQQQQNKYLYDNHQNTNTTTAINTNTNTNTGTYNNNEPIVIAYATVLTDCTKGLKMKVPFQILESAAILQYAVHINSIRNTNNTLKSKYDYKFYLIYHPNASSCVNDFEQFGFIVLQRTFPVIINEMKSELLRTKISVNGCCGERELIKLEAFTLIQHPLVVLLDLDVLLLKPLDILFDYMIYNIPIPSNHILYPSIDQNKIGTQIDLLYTVDYGMAKPDDKPIQGGFVILRPNQTIYNDLFTIIQNGDFRFNGGWHGKSGRFWGAMTYQGIMPYYFIYLYPNRGVELNWCYYNNMKSPSTRTIYNKKTNTQSTTTCRIVGQNPCIDCGTIPYSNIYLFHYTVCQKPWNCIRPHSTNYNTTLSSSLSSSSLLSSPSSLCDIMHHLWFQTRSQMELSWGRSGYGPETKFQYNHFYGYCKNYKHTGYIPIQQPYFLP